MHQIDGTTFPAFSLWKAAEWVAQLTHRLNLPRSPLVLIDLYKWHCHCYLSESLFYATYEQTQKPGRK